jgi:hypothetical protein
LSGDVAQFGLPAVDVDASFSDIFDNLEFGAMAIGEARSGPYSIFADVMYTKTSGQAGTPRGFLASDVELTSETFAGLWCRIRCLRERDSAVGRGGRPARLVCRKSAFLQRRGSRRALQKRCCHLGRWFGRLRGTYSLTPEIYLTGWGLVGAGGADLDWDVAAAIGYRFSDTISAVAGYRALGVDYSNDGFVFDAVQQGPVLGLVLRF